jgi:hypothetical protein
VAYVRRADEMHQGRKFTIRNQPVLERRNNMLVCQALQRWPATIKIALPTREQLESVISGCPAYQMRCTRLTAFISSDWLVLVTVTPRARLPRPRTEFCAVLRAALALSSEESSTYAWLRVLPLRSRRTCTRSTSGGFFSQLRICGGVISYRTR